MNALRCFLILIIAFLISLSGSFGYIVYTIAGMKGQSVPQNALTTRIYDINDDLIAVRYVENRTEVHLESISPYAVIGTVVVEDRRFLEHNGIDLPGLARALVSNIKSRQVSQGGSTITQQLARNIYLDHKQTLERKTKEAIYAIHLERQYSKEEILEKYLNTIYYGHSAYGIEAASLYYFNKHAADLNLAEAALLVGIPRGPHYYSPFINRENALQRQKVVLNLMVEQDVISPQDKEEALNTTLTFREHGEGEKYSYFINHVINNEVAGYFDSDLSQVYKGGLNIYTTLDPSVQEAAEYCMTGVPVFRIDEEGKQQPQGGLVALDPRTGYVLAMAGGRDYDETKLNRVLSPRSPGSSFKPFTYAAALEQGFSAADKVLCEPISLMEPGIDRLYEPADYGGGFHHDELTIREAIACSCNIAAIKTHLAIKEGSSVEMASRLGIKTPLKDIFSLPLGTIEVNLLELTASFAPFANGGYRVEPVFIRKVTDSRGQTLLDNKTGIEKVIDDKVAFLVTDMLRGVLKEGGTAGGVNNILRRPAAGKSGTSHDSKNAHMVGYTPQLVAGLYIGDDYERPLQASGGGLAAPVWAKFIEHALQDEPVLDFSIPPGLNLVELCAESNLLPGESCREPFIKEYFIEGTEPEESCYSEICSHGRPLILWPWLPVNP